MTKSPPSKNTANTPLAYWTNRPGATCSFVSDGWYHLTGQREGRALGAGWLDPIHPDDRDRVEHGFARAYDKRSVATLEYELRRADGSFRRVTDSGAPRFDRRGRFLGIVGSVSESPGPPDLTECLMASNPVVQALFEQTTAGIAIVRRGGHFVRVNDRFCDITGRGRQELAVIRLHEIAHPEDMSRAAQILERLLGGVPSAEFDKRYVRPDGSIVWVHNFVYTITSSDGKSRFAVYIVSDISDRQRIEFERHMRQCPDGNLARIAFDDPDSPLNTWLRGRGRRKR